MNRQKVIDDIKETLGKVPDFLKSLPDETLEYEWGLYKLFEVEETKVPPKYKELMGITPASIMHCWYCTDFYKAMARLHKGIRLV